MLITLESAFGMYLGQMVLDEKKPDLEHKLRYKITGKLCRVSENIVEYTTDKGFNVSDIRDCKLILRPFNDMTEDESRLYGEIRGNKPMLTRKIKHKELEYLISIGIDIFNLKERGWAVYESELNKEGDK